MFKESNEKEIISLEQLIRKFLKSESFSISNEIFDVLQQSMIKNFQIYYGRTEKQQTILEEINCQIRIIRIALTSKKQLINDQKIENFARFLEIFKREKVNWIVVQNISQLMCKISNVELAQQFFKQLFTILYFNYGTDDNQWYQACQEIMNLSKIIPSPESLYETILKKMTVRLLKKCKLMKQSRKPKSSSSSIRSQQQNQTFLDESIQIDLDQNDAIVAQFQYAQLLFMLGNVAIQLLLHLDEVCEQVKHFRIEAEKQVQNNESEELNKISGGFEAEYEEQIDRLHYIAQQNTVFGPLIHNYDFLIKDVIKQMILNQNGIKTKNSQVDSMAVLTISKFCCLSERYCSENIELLFQILRLPNVDSNIKSNLIVSIGDLLHRWPNTVTSYSRLLFENLSDSDYQVKRTTLNVLTHLVLNDMIKIRTEVTDIGVLLTDNDVKIQTLAKQFFYEMNQKDNKLIYNMLPEVINKMSLKNSPEEFKQFINDVQQYLDKDKSIENITEKLLKRLKEDITLEEILNISYTLTVINIRELSLRKIIECFSQFKERLEITEVKENFQIMLKKLKRQQNQEIKILVEELESLINNKKQFSVEPQVKELKRRGKRKYQIQVSTSSSSRSNSIPNSQTQVSISRSQQLNSDRQLTIIEEIDENSVNSL